MDHASRGPASFLTQANALFRKNVNFQKRNLKTNVGIISFPVFLCVLLVLIQNLVNNELDKPGNRCGCSCIDTKGNGTCENVCGIQYSNSYQVLTCPIPSPPEWPALLQIPRPQYRARRTESVPFMDPPATILLTGGNRSLAESLLGNFFSSTSLLLFPDLSSALSNFILGTDTDPGNTQFVEPAFVSHRPLYYVQSQCLVDFALPLPKQIATVIQQDVKRVKCVEILPAWLDSSAEVNEVLFRGYQQGNSRRNINEFVAAYDFLNSDEMHFNVRIGYNSTSNNGNGNSPALVRIPRLLNLVSNAYLEFMRDSSAKMQFDFVKEMPKAATELRLDFSSLLGPLFFTWVVELLFPVMLTYLVYEKQQKLKIMMKMHGLGEGAYWVISYAYFIVISVIYMTSFIIFGSITGLKYFTLNDYSIQFVFFFVCINLQIALAFLTATMFSDVKTATVIGYIYVFGSGLLGAFLFQSFVEDTSFSRGLLLVMESFPGFALYRGLYEFSQYSLMGNYIGTSGMRWRNLNDSNNGMRDALIIMSVEWLVLLPIAYYLDQVAPIGSGVRKDPLFFLQHLWRKPSVSLQKPNSQRQGSEVLIDMEKPDVSQERKVVEQLLCEPSTRYGMVCDNVKKVYQARDGNPKKFAVRGLSLALPRGECFGMLGPNGAGKTSFINMMIGLTAPTSGTAYIGGLDICTDMDKIYTSMGVCPQHDLLWETLTGREHLMFYGRLKNLKGAALTRAVEESLKAVNLFHAGIGNKQAGQYSGGMKRRLSVAISLIGNPKVVYMDEPSTGLDPASRHNLWDVVRHAKNDRAIILTTHSMEEADVLCDRLGIFVDGSLQCIGNPKELKSRYGGSYVFTMTTSSDKEEEVETLARQLSPGAKKIYHISGTQKFELPKQDVRIADVFQAVENAKSKFPINAWGLADTTLEDVFIKVAKGSTIIDDVAP